MKFDAIDMHVHMGPISTMSYDDGCADDLIAYMDKNKIELAVCSTNIDLFYAATDHSMMEEAMERHPGRVYGYYLFNPNAGETEREIEAAFARHKGYIGIKLLPDYHRHSLDSDAYRPALRFAEERSLLLLSHTWGQAPGARSYSTMDKVLPVLEQYRNIRFLMGHSCQGQVDQAIRAASKYENAYLDICDTGRLNGVIERMVAGAGAHKVVFGTDWPQHSPVYLMGGVLYAKISDEEKKMILRGNAARLLAKQGVRVKTE